MCENCEHRVREAVEEGIRLLAHDTSALIPELRAEMESGEVDPVDMDNFFIQCAIARLAMALAMRQHKPPFLVMGELAGTMMAAQMETEAVDEFINSIGLSRN